MPKLLVITADDYGFTGGINRGIEACVSAGSIKSVCVMTNMPLWREIAGLARSHPEVTVGIHWNVTQGRPLLSPRDVPSLVDREGELLPPPRFRARSRRGGVALRELEAELEAQVLRMREVIPIVAYWNTHQNIHVDLGMYSRFAAIGKRLGIRAMRSHRRLVARGGRPAIGYYVRHPLFWLKGLVLGRLASNASRRGMTLPVARFVLPEYPPGSADLLSAFRGTDWEGTAELVTHPASNLDGLRSLSTLLESRLAEFQQLADRSFPARAAELGIHLVGFPAAAANDDGRRSGTSAPAAIRLPAR